MNEQWAAFLNATIVLCVGVGIVLYALSFFGLFQEQPVVCHEAEFESLAIAYQGIAEDCIAKGIQAVNERDECLNQINQPVRAEPKESEVMA